MLDREGIESWCEAFSCVHYSFFSESGCRVTESFFVKPVVVKQSEVAVPLFSRGNVNVRQAVVGQVSGRVFRPTVIPEAYSPKNTRDTLRESGYLVNELESFARTLARFGR